MYLVFTNYIQLRASVKPSLLLYVYLNRRHFSLADLARSSVCFILVLNWKTRKTCRCNQGRPLHWQLEANASCKKL